MKHIKELVEQRNRLSQSLEEAILAEIDRVATAAGVTRMVFTAHYHLLEKVDGVMVEEVTLPEIDQLVKLYRTEVDLYCLEAEWEEGEWSR